MEKLTNEIIERLEYVDGDGVEFEVYQDPETNQLYYVEIEIVRHFKYAQAIDEANANFIIDHRC